MSAQASSAEYRVLPSRRGVIDEASRDCTLYVGNLNPRVTDYHLMKLFGQFGELIRVQFTWHHHGENKGAPKGFAFVEFVNKADAANAAAQANGVELAGRRLTVRFTVDQDKNADATADGDKKLNVDYKTSAERRSHAIGARASQLEGGGGGGRGGFSGGRGGGGGGRGGHHGGGAPENKFAYIPAPIPSSGFNVSARAPKLVALEKIRAIEDKLVAMEAEQRMERREAQRKMMEVDHITKQPQQHQHSARSQQQSQSHHLRQQSPPRDRAPTADQRGEQSRGDSPRRSGFIHPDRRRSRSRSRERDHHRSRH